MISRGLLVALVFLLAVGHGPAVTVADSGPYTVQDVGPVDATALAVNAAGDVAGASGPGNARFAFLTTYGSGATPLAGLSGSADDQAFALHADGWAVGVSKVNFGVRPVSFEGGSAIDLAPLASMGEARAVNASGAIAGWVIDAAGLQAVVWSGGSRLAAPSPTAFAYAINDDGRIAGSRMDGSRLTPFTWLPGEAAVTPLQTLGGPTTEALGINNHGDVVGDSMRSGHFDELAVWWPSSGDLVELGTFGGATSSARDINNHRQIVGYALNAAGQARAFLSDAGGPLVDLNTRLEPGSGWVLLSANAINDAGQIAGEGLLNGQRRAFLLTPPVLSDTEPPVIAAVTTNPSRIWPPNHRMVDVEVSVSATDDSGETPACAVVDVTSSESDNASGDGDTASDTQITGALTLRVRAERSGPAGVRTYGVGVRCEDSAGNAATATGAVIVGEASADTAKRRK